MSSGIIKKCWLIWRSRCVTTGTVVLRRSATTDMVDSWKIIRSLFLDDKMIRKKVNSSELIYIITNVDLGQTQRETFNDTGAWSLQFEQGSDRANQYSSTLERMCRKPNDPGDAVWTPARGLKSRWGNLQNTPPRILCILMSLSSNSCEELQVPDPAMQVCTCMRR